MSLLNFDSNGRLKVPGHTLSKPIDQEKTILLKYQKKENEEFTDCIFNITFPKIISPEHMKQIEEYVNQNNEFKKTHTTATLKKLDSNEFKLTITGQGKDGRCAWCRFFRNALKTVSKATKLEYKQKEFCKFEDGSYQKEITEDNYSLSKNSNYF